MTGQRFSIDTNILVYSIDKDAGVTRLLTEDMQDGRTLGALRLENPFKEGFDLGLD